MKTSIQLKMIQTIAKVGKINKLWYLKGSALKTTIAKKQSKIALPSKKLRESCAVTSHQIEGFDLYEVSPKSDAKNLIIYLAGGGFVLPISSLHWDFIQLLVDETNSKVIVPLYPLAPNHNVDTVMQYLTTIYKNSTQQQQPETITIMGDSAGGNLALAFSIYLKTLGLPQPKQVIAISPVVDLTFSNPDIAAIEAKDYIVGTPALKEIGEWYRGTHTLQSPIISPLFGDFTHTAPRVIFSSTGDLTNPDTRLFAEKNKENTTYYEYPYYPHIFPIYPIPEGEDARRKIISQLKTKNKPQI
ncbi:alpha/beta hydrolase fold domain-containing protein [Paenilisteria newyorkensis]|uniref:alpha/beta hydrolase fold domain-containing protein n=1 Tax=Listeria newyorkensis TaxID=1497681 RepID=UPI000669FF00|nr:alpha/beta hydrolase [Listeria newyorkensis]KMT61408.1 alpha/beta hydrolase [Listeria newyorkensis]